MYAALLAHRQVEARHMAAGLLLMPWPQDVMWVVFHVNGDVVAPILEAVRQGHIASGRRSVGLLAAAEWCRFRNREPIPAALISEARLIARRYWKAEEVPQFIHALALLTGDEALKVLVREKYSETTAEKFAKVEKAVEELRVEFRKVADMPLLDLIPQAPMARSRVLAQGTTMRRAVARVGRNEPCPCGSGKKYKHCCIDKDEERLHHSSHVAGKTKEELYEAPELHLTPEILKKMHTAQLARLDPLQIKRELLEWYFFILALRGMYDEFLAAFAKIPKGDDLYDSWYGGVYWGAYQWQAEFVRTLMEMPDFPAKLREEKHNTLFGVEMLVNERDPAAMLALIEDKAAKMLDESDDAKLQTFAFWLLRNRSLRCLGAFAARGVIPFAEEKSAAFLHKQILELRDELNLPLDDPISDTVDRMLVKSDGANHDDEDAAPLRKAQRRLEKKAAEVREMKESLATMQRALALREKKEKRAAEENAPEPTSEQEKKETAELRSRFEKMKSVLKQTHTERNEFRRELEQAHMELEQLRAQKPPNTERESPDTEEALLLPPEPASNQPVRMLEFPKKFEEVLRSVPRHIARNTMVTLGQIAGGEPAGFVGARRLNVCEDITRQRIGGDYRLLFRLLPDRVQVVTLINRRELDRTIKSLV